AVCGIVKDYIDFAVTVQVAAVDERITGADEQWMEGEPSGSVADPERCLAGVAVVYIQIGFAIAREIGQAQEREIPADERVSVVERAGAVADCGIHGAGRAGVE